MNDAYVDAEKHLRRSVALAPGDWLAWSQLGDDCLRVADKELREETARFGGDFHFKPDGDCKTYRVEFGPKSTVGSLEELFKSLEQKPPSADRLSRAERQLTEAASCYDLAVAAAPQEPAVYTGRWSCTYSRAVHGVLLALLRRDQQLAKDRMEAAVKLATDSPDMLRAARCQSSEPAGAYAAVVLQIAHVAFADAEGVDAQSCALDQERFNRTARDAEERLVVASRSPDRKMACQAFVVKSHLAALRKDYPAAEAAARRAVELDDASELAWSVLLSSIKVTASDFIPLCEKSVARFDCQFYHSELASAYSAAGKAKEAEGEIRTILKEVPDDIPARAQLAALYLRSADVEALKKGNEALSEVERLIVANPKHPLSNYVAALRAAFCALNGDAVTARVMLESICEKDKNAELAKSILDALPAAAK